MKVDKISIYVASGGVYVTLTYTFSSFAVDVTLKYDGAAGDINATDVRIALTDAVKTVSDIVHDTVDDIVSVLSTIADAYEIDNDFMYNILKKRLDNVRLYKYEIIDIDVY